MTALLDSNQGAPAMAVYQRNGQYCIVKTFTRGVDTEASEKTFGALRATQHGLEMSNEWIGAHINSVLEDEMANDVMQQLAKGNVMKLFSFVDLDADEQLFFAIQDKDSRECVVDTSKSLEL